MRGLDAERIAARVRSRLFQVPQEPVKVDRYELGARVGEGGMGTVYRARDPQLQRDVAVKLLRPVTSEEKLLEEARAMAKLEHPNVLAIHDMGTHEGQVFLVMKYVDGQNLGAWLRETKRPVAEVVRVFAEAARGLAALHRAGIVHRDFKPENVLLDQAGRVVVADFGLARDAPEAAVPDTGPMLSTHVAGTPAFMAPELLDGERATFASDQWAFCVALHYALNGKLPFPSANVTELRAAHRLGARPADPSVPAWLRHIASRGLELAPGVRHPSMEAVAAALDKGPSRLPVVLASVLTAAFLGLAAAAWGLTRPESPAPAPVVTALKVPDTRKVPDTGQPTPVPEPVAVPPHAPAPQPHVAEKKAAKKVGKTFNDVWDEAYARVKKVPYQSCYSHEFVVSLRFAGDGTVRSLKLEHHHTQFTPEQRECLERGFGAVRIPEFDHDPMDADGFAVQFP